MNQFPKPQGGAYRPLLVDLLTKIGNQKLPMRLLVAKFNSVSCEPLRVT